MCPGCLPTCSPFQGGGGILKDTLAKEKADGIAGLQRAEAMVGPSTRVVVQTRNPGPREQKRSPSGQLVG